MKTTILLLALCLGAVSQAQVVTPPEKTKTVAVPIGMPKDGVRTKEDFLKILTSNKWRWYEFGKPEKHYVHFTANGQVLVTGAWVGKYEIKEGRQVVIRVTKWIAPGTARMTFNPEFTAFSGTDIDGIRPLVGEIEAASPTP